MGSLTLFPGSWWSFPFFLTVIVTSMVVLAFLGFIFSTFETNIVPWATQTSETKTIPTYLALFIFAEFYQIVLSYEALRNKNTIQIIWLCGFNFAMIVYSSIQYDQIQTAIMTLYNSQFYSLGDWPLMRAFVISLPCVIGLGAITMTGLAYKLYQEFGWSVYKYVGADIQLKRRYSAYLHLVTLLKFDFFFFLGFTIQFIVIVLEVEDVEFALTIVVIPVTIAILYLTYVSVKKEWTKAMIALLVWYLLGVAYFLFKLIRMYQPSQSWKYLATRKTLTAFAIVTLLLIFATATYMIICMRNFGSGLKQVISGGNRSPIEQKYPMDDTNPFGDQPKTSVRMTID